MPKPAKATKTASVSINEFPAPELPRVGPCPSGAPDELPAPMGCAPPPPPTQTHNYTYTLQPPNPPKPRAVFSTNPPELLELVKKARPPPNFSKSGAPQACQNQPKPPKPHTAKYTNLQPRAPEKWDPARPGGRRTSTTYGMRAPHTHTQKDY